MSRNLHGTRAGVGNLNCDWWRQLRELRTLGRPSHKGTPILLGILPSGVWPGSHNEFQRKKKMPRVSDVGGGGAEPFRTFCSSYRGLPSEGTIQLEPDLPEFYQSLTDLKEGKYPASDSPGHHVPPKRCGNWEAHVKFRVQELLSWLSRLQTQCASVRMLQVWSLALHSGLRVRHCRELWCGSQMWLGSCIVVALA